MHQNNASHHLIEQLFVHPLLTTLPTKFTSKVGRLTQGQSHKIAVDHREPVTNLPTKLTIYYVATNFAEIGFPLIR